VDYEPKMSGKMRKQVRELARLSGARFEIAFMQMMIEHHAEAVEEGEECLDRAYHDELIELCEGMVSTQTMEIELMEGWLCEWYQLCE
jgi:uncharacterized protein (DUF305 family)